jgi:hypothetical protein
MKTNIYSNAGKQIAYHGLVYYLTDSDARKLLDIRQQIAQIFGGDILLAPNGTLHISILHLTPQKKEKKDFTSLISEFDHNKVRYIDRIIEVVESTPSFMVNFNLIEASKDAIILRGNDNGGVAHIRSVLSDLVEPDFKTNDLDFIHSTQARFIKNIDLANAQHKVKQLKLNVSINIDKLSLVRATIAFTKRHKIIHQFPLQG